MKDKDGFDIGFYGIAVERRYIDGAFAWALKDPDKWYGCEEKGWTGLKNLYVAYNRKYWDCEINGRKFRISPLIDGAKIPLDYDNPIPMEIPELPPGYGGRWIKCVFSMWKWYKSKLQEIRTPTDQDRWDSFVISYLAIHKLAETNQHCEMSLVYKACKRDHLDYLKRIKKQSCEVIPDTTSAPETDIDMQLDVQSALNKLPEKQYIIARLRLMENMDWGSIAEEVDMSESHVRRIYKDAESSLKESLKDYAIPD